MEQKQRTPLEQEHLDELLRHKYEMDERRSEYLRRAEVLQGASEYVPANLGRNHPDYGLSWEDHQKAKEARKNAANSR